MIIRDFSGGDDMRGVKVKGEAGMKLEIRLDALEVIRLGGEGDDFEVSV